MVFVQLTALVVPFVRWCGTVVVLTFVGGCRRERLQIVEGKATAVVVASADSALASCLATLISSQSFRAFTSSDVIGVEVGGAVKNVIAIAAGISDGLGLGTCMPMCAHVFTVSMAGRYGVFTLELSACA